MPRFILFCPGTTGSGKTSFSLTILCLFGAYTYSSPAPLRFEDTTNGVERPLALPVSMPLLLDDKKHNSNKKQEEHERDVFEKAIRLIGDRTGKKRANADGTNRAEYPAKAGLIVTSEQSYPTHNSSSIARTFLVEVKPGDIKLPNSDDEPNAFTIKDINGVHLNRCMSKYIQWLIVNEKSVKSELKMLHDKYRAETRIKVHPRIIENIAHERLGLHFMLEWLKSENQITAEQAEKMEAEAAQCFCEAGIKQAGMVVAESPVTMFADAVKQFETRYPSRFTPIDALEAASNNPNRYAYKDENYYYFYPDIYKAVFEFYKEQDVYFPATSRDLCKQLINEGWLIPDKPQNGKVQNGKKLPKSNSSKRFWHIKAKLFEDDEKEGD